MPCRQEDRCNTNVSTSLQDFKLLWLSSRTYGIL
jgi:hypothetical protein